MMNLRPAILALAPVIPVMIGGAVAHPGHVAVGEGDLVRCQYLASLSEKLATRRDSGASRATIGAELPQDVVGPDKQLLMDALFATPPVAVSGINAETFIRCLTQGPKEPALQ